MNVYVKKYKSIKEQDLGKYATEEFLNVSDKDKKRGWVERFFVRQVNNEDARIIEVNRPQYTELKLNHFYTSISIRWKITGKKEDVIKTNAGISVKRDKEFPGLDNKLRKDFLKYYSDS